ncbi:MAG: hypothetical protein NVS9B11_21470 [Candidatus Dormibacteraceae bacterium]
MTRVATPADSALMSWSEVASAFRVVSISMPNLLVILGMIVLFAVALVVPFPHGKEGEDGRH